MKNLYTGLCALLLSCSSLTAQNKIDKINITYGEEITDDKGKIVKMIGEANNKIYTLVAVKDDYYLKIFDSKEMKQRSVGKIVLPEIKDKDVNFEEIYLIGDKLYIIGSVYHRKDKVFTLIGVPVSEDGKLGKDHITLFESKVAKSSDRGEFYFRQSPDEQVLLVMHAALFDKENAFKYEIKLFDSNLASAFSASDKVSFDDNKKDFEFTISDMELNDADDVFVVINEGYRDKKKKEKVEKIQLHEYKRSNNYQKQVVSMDLSDKEIINCKMMANGTNSVKLVGFYSSVRENGKANKELKGVYAITANLATDKFENAQFNEFDYATKVKLLGERRAKKGKDVKPLYQIHSVISKADGGIIMLSEYRLITAGSGGGIGPIQVTSVVYTTNEVIVTALKPDGSLDWSNVVAKEQSAAVTKVGLAVGMFMGGGNYAVGISTTFPLGVMGRGPEYLSFIPIYRNGQLSVIFNDNVKNKGITDIEEIKSMGNYNNAVPTLFEFDNKGNITRKDPEEVIKNELVLRPGVFYRKYDNEYLIYASRKSKDKIGRMILQD